MATPGIYAFDDFELDLNKLELTRAGKPTRTNVLSLRLLGVLVQSAGRVVSKQELLDRVWDGRAVSDNVVSVAMARLRRALGQQDDVPEVVVSVHGRGYRFVREVVQRELAALVSRATPNNMRGSDEAFVGRESVLGQLRAALTDARRGSGGLMLLTGEPGIGKTRAAEVFGAEASSLGLPVAWGYCREVGDTPPLWPFTELLRALITQTRLDGTHVRFAELMPQLTRLLPELATSLGTRANTPAGSSHVPARKHRIFDAIARTLVLAGERAPCLLVLDDLHRADPASLELLNYLLDELPRTRLLLVAALRNKTGVVSEALARVLGHRNATRIALPRLSEAHVGRYLGAVLGHVDDSLSRAVYARSEGNPFFMTELARQLRLSESNARTNITVPDAALDVVRQHVASLDEAARAALSCAAVIGRSFSLPLLQAVTGGDNETLMGSLDAARASEVVLTRHDSLTEFVFGHELLRAVLYDALSASERRHCHLRVVQALEQRLAHGEGVTPADLAYHARAALPLGDLRKTVRYCIDAGTAAANVFAFADAARCLQHALETLDMIDKPSARMRVGLLLHQALFTRSYSTRDFQPLIARVVQLAHEHGEADPLARAAMLHDPYPGLPPLPGALKAFRDALRLLESQPGEPSLRAAMLARLAASPPLAFDAAASNAQLERAEQLAASSSELLDEFSVRAAQLYMHGGPAEPERNEQRLSELQRLCRQHSLVLSVPPVMLELHRALRSLQLGDPVAMRDALARGTARCRKLDSELLWLFERCTALAQFTVAHTSEAHRSLVALHERARLKAISGSELFCAFDEAVVFDGAANRRHALRETLAQDEADRPNVWSLKLRGLAAAGHLAEASGALRRVAPSDLAKLPCDRDYLGTLGGLARVALQLKALDYAEALFALLAPYPRQFAVSISFHCEGSVSQLLGMLAHALGRHAQASTYLADAVQLSERAGLEALAEDARRELARCTATDATDAAEATAPRAPVSRA